MSWPTGAPHAHLAEFTPYTKSFHARFGDGLWDDSKATWVSRIDLDLGSIPSPSPPLDLLGKAQLVWPRRSRAGWVAKTVPGSSFKVVPADDATTYDPATLVDVRALASRVDAEHSLLVKADAGARYLWNPKSDSWVVAEESDDVKKRCLKAAQEEYERRVTECDAEWKRSKDNETREHCLSVAENDWRRARDAC